MEIKMFSFSFYNADHFTEMFYNVSLTVTPSVYVSAFVETGSWENYARGGENFLNRFCSAENIQLDLLSYNFLKTVQKGMVKITAQILWENKIQ